MRKMIKRLLKKYKYPPEEAANALETVIRQCKQWTDNDDSEPLYQKAPKKYEFPESSSYTIAAEPNIKESPIYQQALQAFIKQHRSDAGKLSQYIHDENREAIGKLAHSLKGASALMGFEQLAFIATELENSVMKAENLKALRDFPPRLLKALNEAISVPDDI